jgi:FlaA1/EpsC-like NDP-sugar epimerase
MFEAYPKLIEYMRTETSQMFQKYTLPRWLVFVMDNLVVLLVFFLAYLLRFNFEDAEIKFDLVFKQALIVLGTFALFAIIFRSYSGIIRHTTLTDIFLVIVVTTISSASLLILTLCSRFFNWDEILSIPISIILINYGSVTVLLFSIRIVIKIIFRFATSSMTEKKQVLIYGAGEMGFIVKRVIVSDPKGNFSVAGFIDNDKKNQGKKINGLPVYSPKILSKDFLLKHKIETLIIAIKDILPSSKSEIIQTAMEFGLEILETPAVDKWLNGQLQVRQLQKVKLEDLLGRNPIKLDMDLIGKGLDGMTVLVTGAAGSIGSEIVRQIARFRTRKVVLVDQAETPMFHLERELQSRYGQLQYQLFLADVTNSEKMESIFQEFHPDIVFHAAAYKHVPLMEENPHEALRVNVGGTKLITDLSVKYNAKKFVMISTDKSVNPSSVMGASKRVCEMIVHSRAQQAEIKTQFVITRFGNVLGSNGSVIPLFNKQIEEGGPVTVTHPEMTRYFMTIPEACELVLEAGFMGKGGEIFVFDMGKPIKIADLAYQMILLSGFIPGKDIQIAYTGLRHGEKLYEELLSDKEITLPTYHPKIKIAQVDSIGYSTIIPRVDDLLKRLYSLSKQEVVEFFRENVPEFTSSNGNYNHKPDKDVSSDILNAKENLSEKTI